MKKLDNIITIKRLPGSRCPQQTNMHFNHESYLIILLTEVRVHVVSHTICCRESVAFLPGEVQDLQCCWYWQKQISTFNGKSHCCI